MRTPIERFMRMVSPDPVSGCWLWTGAMSEGYGKFSMVALGLKNLWAHRASLMLLRGVEIGPYPAVCVDHKCRNRACVNPDHLELVSQKENVARAAHVRRPWLYGETPQCRHGHALTPGNLRSSAKGGSKCRTCFTAMTRARVARFTERHGADRMNGYKRKYAKRRRDEQAAADRRRA